MISRTSGSIRGPGRVTQGGSSVVKRSPSNRLRPWSTYDPESIVQLRFEPDLLNTQLASNSQATMRPRSRNAANASMTVFKARRAAGTRSVMSSQPWVRSGMGR